MTQGQTQNAVTLWWRCRRKIRHETKDAARQHAGQLLQDSGDWLGEYRCRYCDGWHVGHIPIKGRKWR